MYIPNLTVLKIWLSLSGARVCWTSGVTSGDNAGARAGVETSTSMPSSSNSSSSEEMLSRRCRCLGDGLWCMIRTMSFYWDKERDRGRCGKQGNDQ
ncbi:hypothetical protein BC940DRAFT_314276, partial [Gongronella butleri]